MLFGAIDGLGNILSSGIDFIVDCIGGLLSGLLNGLESLGKLFSDCSNMLLSAIVGLMEDIRNMLVALLIPEEGFFDDKIASIRSEFGFVDSVIDTVGVFFDFFTSQKFETPPLVNINLGSSEGKYDYGTSALALDMSWYKRYKPSVDVILSAFLWLVFVWNTFMDLPGIVSGVGNTAVSTDIAIEQYQKEKYGGGGK